MVVLIVVMPIALLFLVAFCYDARYRRKTGSRLSMKGKPPKTSLMEMELQGSSEGVAFDRLIRDRSRPTNYGDIGPK